MTIGEAAVDQPGVVAEAGGMRVITQPDELRAVHGGAFVPTMGALHAGHIALVRRAVEWRDHGGAPDSRHGKPGYPVVVSIFVNPTQFGPGEDFTRYPRTLEKDLELLHAAGADVAFTPSVETMYPRDEEIVAPPLPGVATEPKLEDAFRPTHFRGVCQVVARLFDLVQPRAAIFGEKDYQQLRVIQEMVAQQQRDSGRWNELEIVAHPTVREADGLAMSSRNAYLTPAEREQALGLSLALYAAQMERPWRQDDAEFSMRRMLAGHGLKVDYAVIRDSMTLMEMKPPVDPPCRALIAARVGSVRLIDNAAIPADR